MKAKLKPKSKRDTRISVAAPGMAFKVLGHVSKESVGKFAEFFQQFKNSTDKNLH